MLNAPFYLSATMFLATAIALYFFYKATESKTAFFVAIGWAILQSVVSYSGFYTKIEAMPPHFILAVVPAFITIIFLFILPKGRAFMDTLDAKYLTYLHTSRIVVELVLWGLFIYKFAPKDLTFEGRNFDILAGLTAPLIAYYGLHKKLISNKLMLLWNVTCLALLVNVVTMGVLSAPLPFQQMNFDQPNVGLLYFPFIFIPSVVVQLVLFSHLVMIRRLLKKA